MTDETHGVAAPVAPTELKSIDTSTKAQEVNISTPKPVVVKPETVVKPPEGDSTPNAPVADSPANPDQRESRRVKERLERMRRETEASTRAAVLKEIESRQQPTAQPQPIAEAAPTLKTLEDFNFDQAAYIKYMVKVERDAERQAEQQEQARRKQAEAHESFKSHVDAFEAKAGDGAWEDITSSPLNTDPAYKPLTELFMGDDHDLEIAHYLATNIDEAKRINALPQLQKVREIAKLADRFEGSEPEEAPKPVATPKKVTSAPPPVKTVTGSGKPSVDIRDPEMSTADRIKAWKKQGGR